MAMLHLAADQGTQVGTCFVWWSTIHRLPCCFTSILVCQATADHLRCHVAPEEPGLNQPLHTHAVAVSMVLAQALNVMNEDDGCTSCTLQTTVDVHVVERRCMTL